MQHYSPSFYSFSHSNVVLMELSSAQIFRKYRRYYSQQYQYSDINNPGFHRVFVKLADASLFDGAIALQCCAERFQSAMMSMAYKEGLSFPPAALNKVIVAANQDVRQVRMHCNSALYKLPYLNRSFARFIDSQTDYEGEFLRTFSTSFTKISSLCQKL